MPAVGPHLTTRPPACLPPQVVPHSISVNLSFPNKIGGADNVYGILPMSKGKVGVGMEAGVEGDA